MACLDLRYDIEKEEAVAALLPSVAENTVHRNRGHIGTNHRELPGRVACSLY